MKSIICLVILLIQWRACTCAPHMQIRDDAGDYSMLSEHSPGEVLTRELRSRSNYCPSAFGLSLKLGEIGSHRFNAKCLIIECKQVHGALTFGIDRVTCSDLDSVTCDGDLTPQQVEALKCCSKCSIAPVSSLNIPEEKITTTSISVEWTYDEDGGQIPITGVDIIYTATNNYDTPSDGVISVSYPDTSAVITGLQPLTTYSICVVVNNEVSRLFGSSPAKCGVVDTLPLAPFSPLVISVTVIGPTELKVKWTAISNPKFQTELHMYKVKYCEQDGNETALYVRHPDVSITLTDLEPDTCYQVTVCATNTGGSSPDSNSVIACTKEEEEPEDKGDEDIPDDNNAK